MAMKIELEPKTATLTIGDKYAKENTIKFKIVLTGDGPVWLSLKIPLGKDGVLRQVEDANDIVVATPGNYPSPRVLSSTDTEKKWSLGDYDDGVQVSGSNELSVSISKILCRASDKASEIAIIGETGSSSPDEIKAVLKIEKAKPTEDANPILYFIAEPTYLIGSGEVTLTWDVVGNPDEVTLDTPQQKEWKPTNISTTEQLSQTFAYTLKLKRNQRQVTVNVLTEGWHKLYPLGNSAFPSVIFDAAGRTADALYAIFVCDGTGGRETVLCKSADGITGWQVINEAVPDGMESSPGVQLGNRLWLIGGSEVDPEQISNSIYYYDLDSGKTSGGWKEAVVEGFDDGARMGHACVIVDDKTIWVLGGQDKYSTVNDVWSLTIDDSGEAVKAERLDEPGWSPRCMFGAVNFDKMIWVCGGVSSPNGNPPGDLWASPHPAAQESKSSDIAWKERPTGENGSVVANAIGTGAAVCNDTLFTLITNRTGGPNWLLNTEMWTIGKSGITTTSDTWTRKQLPELTTNLPPTPHSIAVVCFKNRLYFRRLYRNHMYGEVVRPPLYVYVMS